MPINYFSLFTGAMIDLTIMMQLLKKFFPDFFKLMEYDPNNYECLKNLVLQWFFSLFTEFISFNLFKNIWDCFLLKGCIVFFYATIVLVKILSENSAVLDFIQRDKKRKEEESKGNFTIEENQETFSNVINNEILKLSLSSIMKYHLLEFNFGFNIEHIQLWRETARNEVGSQLTDLNKGMKKRRNTFLTKDECDLDWPICLYDRDYRFTPIEYTVFRKMNPPKIIDGYFFEGCFFLEEYKSLNTAKNQIEENISESEAQFRRKIKIFEDIMIERRKHICGSKKSTRMMMYEKSMDSAKKIENYKLEKEKSSLLTNTINNSFLEGMSKKQEETISKIVVNMNFEAGSYKGEGIEGLQVNKNISLDDS
ncbi:MAG: TBC domain-containing protein [archaeon]|nr:TBC domain-containing protein [archaeon]